MGDKIHCNKAGVKPFCCSDGKGGWGSLQILAVIRKIKGVFVLLAGHKSPPPPLPRILRTWLIQYFQIGKIS